MPSLVDKAGHVVLVYLRISGLFLHYTQHFGRLALEKLQFFSSLAAVCETKLSAWRTAGTKRYGMELLLSFQKENSRDIM